MCVCTRVYKCVCFGKRGIVWALWLPVLHLWSSPQSGERRNEGKQLHSSSLTGLWSAQPCRTSDLWGTRGVWRNFRAKFSDVSKRDNWSFRKFSIQDPNSSTVDQVDLRHTQEETHSHYYVSLLMFSGQKWFIWNLLKLQLGSKVEMKFIVFPLRSGGCQSR